MGNIPRKCYLAAFGAYLAAGGALAQPTAESLARQAASAPSTIAGAYAARAYAPVWLRDDAAAARALIAALRRADAHGLPVARYGAEALAARLSAEDGAQDAALEMDLSRAFLSYARDVSAGLLDPASTAPDIHRQAPRVDAAALMKAAAAAPDMAAHLETLPPQSEEYARLVGLYADLTALRAQGGWGAKVADGPTLRPGARGARVAQMRSRLRAQGDYRDPAPGDAAAQTPEPEFFDDRLAAALRAFQKRHGLNEDAALGAGTRAALNAEVAYRRDQTAVNLERARWMNRPMGASHIVVNIPAFTVTLHRDGRALFQERVVVGEREHQTPEFSDQMEYMVLNPAWNVPRSITVKELLPRLRSDPGYLARRNMRLIPTDGGPEPDPATHDFTYYDESYFPFRIQQAPTGDNALGVVKFMFPNRYSIYLHDTPSKRLFARDDRAKSHGCVRVQDPLRLAQLLLAPQMADSGAFMRRVIADGKERHVTLDAKLPVHIVYRTVWRDAVDGPQFRKDVYGRDRAVIRALRAAGALEEAS